MLLQNWVIKVSSYEPHWINVFVCHQPQGGQGVRVVDCVLALKSFSDAKQVGKQSPFKYGGIVKPLSGKYAIRKNNEAFMKTMVRSHSAELLRDGISLEQIGLDFSLEPTETVRVHYQVLFFFIRYLSFICGDTHILGCRLHQIPSGCLFKLFFQIKNQKKFHRWAYCV